jgi:methylenetetrahydrofolate dehydrogenase (NADP+) / methenyltetrahydrofolate cyclohydrolase
MNVGKLATGQPGLVPCTPYGCMILLKSVFDSLAGKKAVVIGRSNIVGKPMAQLLIAAHCTVTIAHSRTVNLPDVVRDADIVIAAVGQPEMVKGSWLKPGAVVIDVGMNRIALADGLKTKLVGDVDYASASEIARAITPVPGGVGPMTIACLLRNTLVAALLRRHLAIPNDLMSAF